jgi:serine/threonine protein kinase
MPGAPGRTQLEAAAGGPHAPPQSTMLDSRLVGTPSYMDPEYLRTGRFGPKSDTYSLGELRGVGGGAAVMRSTWVGSLLACWQAVLPQSSSWLDGVRRVQRFAHFAAAHALHLLAAKTALKPAAAAAPAASLLQVSSCCRC